MEPNHISLTTTLSFPERVSKMGAHETLAVEPITCHANEPSETDRIRQKQSKDITPW
jgi:hypothetical protein